MSYCEQADLLQQIDEAMLIQLTDDDNLGAVAEDVVARAIADADGEIDGYLGARHSVPLDPVPDIVRKCSADIAIYNLFSRRGAAPELRAERYKGAVKFLEHVAKGVISLGADDPEGSPPNTDAPEFHSSNPDRIFNRNNLKGF